ncbi:hypothetical protein [Thiohalophilus thiocyanatoxydans]|uniref:Uncharacterized protein n=1 Tax=Thiohalophilus thiocyanatoxydans TaxID=381308 RepID=A0A4R8ING8_9GAMM|nr:hypothetical protein [Thiohalophilus thiocyanatoxydans]TDY02421.1 hypothetical protein EDC23_0790 [Thiohalophilus thiocyanatoxydans]
MPDEKKPNKDLPTESLLKQRVFSYPMSMRDENTVPIPLLPPEPSSEFLTRFDKNWDPILAMFAKYEESTGRSLPLTSEQRSSMESMVKKNST